MCVADAEREIMLSTVKSYILGIQRWVRKGEDTIFQNWKVQFLHAIGMGYYKFLIILLDKFNRRVCSSGTRIHKEGLKSCIQSRPYHGKHQAVLETNSHNI